MIELYKRVKKDKENPRGSKKIEEGENPFKGPTVLCISAQDHIPKSVFGITKNCMALARLRTLNEKNARFKVEDFPAIFLSIKNNSSKDDETEEMAINQFVDKYFSELVMQNGEKIPIQQIQKNLRNINMISYCNGTIRALKIVETLQKQMEKNGYSNEEINDAISQIALVTLSTERKLNNEKCTIVDFHDLNDKEVENTNLTSEMIERTLNSPINECITKIPGENRAEYTLLGTGEHEVAQYKKDGKALPAVVSKVLGNIIENSIENNNNNFKPLSIDNMIEGTDNIIKNAEKGKTREELMEDVDKSLYYGGTAKYSESECDLLDELDVLYKKNARLEHDLQGKTRQLSDANKKINDIKKVVKENATDATYIKVLYGIGWNYSKEDQEKLGAPSDKEIIQEKDEQISKLQIMLNKTLKFADRVRKSRFGKLLFRKDIKMLPEASKEKIQER